MARMILVQVPTGMAPTQVEFPEFRQDARGRPVTEGDGKSKKPVAFGDRSCEGSMHLRPGSTKLMTVDEFDYIQKRVPFGHVLRVIKEIKPGAATKLVRPPAKLQPESRATTPVKIPEASPEREPKPSKGENTKK